MDRHSQLHRHRAHEDAKLANKVAKSDDGVIDLGDTTYRDSVLRIFPVANLWGVGRRLAPRLEAMGISTAAALRDAPADDILATFGVTLARTQRELQGHSCMDLEEMEPDRQHIMVSRSFADRVEDHEAVAQALATFAVRACEKLRARGAGHRGRVGVRPFRCAPAGAAAAQRQ